MNGQNTKPIRACIYLMIPMMVSILYSLPVSSDSGDVGFCINSPPRINSSFYYRSFDLLPHLKQVVETDINAMEGDDVSILFCSDDKDGDELNYSITKQMIWNGSSPPDVGIYEWAENVGRINLETENYFDDRNTLYMQITVMVDDNSSCSNSRDSRDIRLLVAPFDYPIEFLSYSPDLSVTINETQNLTFVVNYSEPDNNPALTINYPDITYGGSVNNTIDDDVFSMEWRLDGVQQSFENITDFRHNGTTTFTFYTDYKSAGDYSVMLFARSFPSYYLRTLGWNVTVQNVNRKPFFNITINDYDWYQRNTFRAFYLEDYVFDADVEIGDGDSLSFRMNNLNGTMISARIDPDPPYLVTFSQPDSFNGTEIKSFTVTDSHGASNVSNNITLTVKPLGSEQVSGIQESTGEETASSMEEEEGSSGAGKAPPCEEEWFCTRWVCKPENIMYRTCYDLNNCPRGLNKPPEVDECEYVPECYDGIQNQAEDGIDCGGPCPPCWTCYDRVKNQGEEGIDCGGPCKPCPNCTDGKRNGGETAVDCGGPCPPCGNCSDGIMNQDEQGIDCGGRCRPCKESEIQMGVNLKVGKNPFRYITLLGLSMAALVAIITATLHFGHSFSDEMHSFISLFRPVHPKSKPIPRPVKRDTAKEALSNLKKLKRTSTHYTSRDIDILSSSMRDYTMDLFRLTPGFTIEDLRAGLRSHQANPTLSDIFLSFFEKLNLVAYSGQTMLGREFQALVKEGIELVSLTSENGRRSHASSRRKKKGIRVTHHDTEDMFRMISSAYDMLSDGDGKAATDQYHGALEIYEGLPERAKKRHYDSLERIRREIDLFENKFSKK
jgi:hypothetical protein